MARPERFDPERPITIAEFERLPEEDAYRIELVRGKLVRSPRPAARHGRFLIRLAYLLERHVEATGHGVLLGDTGVVLERDPDTVRGPDVAFFTPQRIPEGGYGVTFWGPPDLAVEITSPSNRISELQEKVLEYLNAGVRRVWVVDPSTNTVTVHRAGGEARVLRSGDVLEDDEALGGFRLPLATLFAL